MPRCGAFKADGTGCQRIVAASRAYCYSHDPKRATERHLAASKAGRTRHNPEIRMVKSNLQELFSDVLGGQVDRRDAAVAAQVGNVLLRALEVDRRLKESAELEERLDALEGLLAAAEQRTYARR